MQMVVVVVVVMVVVVVEGWIGGVVLLSRRAELKSMRLAK